jgi:hypothetical protein
LTCGFALKLGHHGGVDVERGLLRPPTIRPAALAEAKAAQVIRGLRAYPRATQRGRWLPPRAIPGFTRESKLSRLGTIIPTGSIGFGLGRPTSWCSGSSLRSTTMSSEMSDGHPAPQEHLRGRSFAPGNPGRRPGSKNKITRVAEALLRGEEAELVRKAVELAKAGDVPMLKFLLDRILAKQRRIELELPEVTVAADAVHATGAVLDAVGTGQITASEGAALAAIVETYTRSIDVHELVSRVEKLEKARKND